MRRLAGVSLRAHAYVSARRSAHRLSAWSSSLTLGAIVEAQVGFMGPPDAKDNPTYREVCSGDTGHVEVHLRTCLPFPFFFLFRSYFRSRHAVLESWPSAMQGRGWLLPRAGWANLFCSGGVWPRTRFRLVTAHARTVILIRRSTGHSSRVGACAYMCGSSIHLTCLSAHTRRRVTHTHKLA